MKKRKCAYSKCDEYFEIKNPKKSFCCLSCKNKAAYLYKLQNYPWEIAQFKFRRKNIQILEYLYNQGILRVTLDNLKLMGFTIECAIIASKNEQKQSVFRFGNTLLTIISDKECEITKI